MANVVKELKGSHGVTCAQLHRHVNILKHCDNDYIDYPYNDHSPKKIPSFQTTSGLASPLSTIRTASNKKGTSSLPEHIEYMDKYLGPNIDIVEKYFGSNIVENILGQTF